MRIPAKKPVALLPIAIMVISMIQSARVESVNLSDNLEKASLSERVSIESAGRGNPWMNLSDGREVITDYSGPAELVEALRQNEARPLSLDSADFDKDGMADIASGYGGPNGGIITLHRGSVDAPFLKHAAVFALPEPADFIGAGDFDADGNLDVVSAARGGSKLYVSAGDGSGGITTVREIGLPGRVTALRVGEINRADGLEDIVVGITGEAGAKALVFEGPEGALRASPETFELRAEVSGFAIGQIDEQREYDLLVAAGRELVVIAGRDRKLSLNKTERAQVKAAQVVKSELGFGIRGIEVGDFTGRRRIDVALLSDRGEVVILSEEKSGKPILRLDMWKQERLRGGGQRMVKAGVSAQVADELLVTDGNRLRVITHTRREAEQEQGGETFITAEEGRREEVSFEVDGEAVAAIGAQAAGRSTTP